MTDPLARAFEAHREQVERAMASGDPAEIKRLYADLGDLLADAVGDDVTSAPVLSLPETGRVVPGLFRGVSGRILDAGCGPNPALSVALGLEPGRTIVGLDIGHGTVRLARALAHGAGTRFLAVVADVEALPFRDDVFDGIVCDDTIEHLPDDERGAAELARVARSDGRIVVATPNRRSLEILLQKARDLLRGKRRPASDYYVVESHLREYTWGGLARVLRPSMRLQGRASVGWDGGWKKRLASRLVKLPGVHRFARMVVFVGEPRD